MLTGADTLSRISEPSNKQKVQYAAAAATHTWELQFSQKKPVRDSDAEKSLKLCVCKVQSAATTATATTRDIIDCTKHT